jgi:hypothetical protein
MLTFRVIYVLMIRSSQTTRHSKYESGIHLARLVPSRTALGSKPGGGEIFPTRPYRPWGPSNLLFNGYRVFPWG